MTGVPLDRRTLLGLVAATGASAPVALAQPGPVPPMDGSAVWTENGSIGCGGGQLAWSARGTGAPLVLLHKLGGWRADWRHVASLLAQDRSVIAFDLPGHGDSGMYGPAPYIMTVPEIGAMLLSALDTLDIEKADIVGNSLGGVVAIWLATMFPQRVGRLLLLSTSLTGAMSRAEIDRQDEERRSAGLAEGVMGTASFQTLVPAVEAEQQASRVRAGPWLRACERGVGRFGVASFLPQIACPTLVVNADRGRYVRYAELARTAIRNVEPVTISGSGAFVHQEKPVETARAMLKFLTAS